MKTSQKRSGFIGALLLLPLLLVGFTSVAQAQEAQGTLRINVFEDTTEIYNGFAPWCDPGNNPATCLPQSGVELCIDGTITCETTDANGNAVFTGLAYTATYKICEQEDNLAVVAGSAGAPQSAPPDDVRCIEALLDEPDLAKAMFVEDISFDIGVQKKGNPTAVAGGGSKNVVHEVAVKNFGPYPVTGARFCDTPNLDLTDVTIENAGVPLVSKGTVGALDASNDCPGGWLWEDLDLAVDEVATLKLELTVGPGGIVQTITDKIEFLDAEFGFETGQEPNGAKATTDVERWADIGVVKKTADPTVVAGDGPGGVAQITHEVKVTNTGPSDADAVVFCDAPTIDLTDITVDASTNVSKGNLGGLGSCTNGFLWDGFGLKSQESATLKLVLNIGAGAVVQTIVDNIAFTGFGPNGTETQGKQPTAPDQASATTKVTRVSDLKIVKVDAPDPVIAGDCQLGNTPPECLNERLKYTITVQNLGPSDADNVKVVDTLPPNVLHFSNTDSCTPGVGSPGPLTCTGGTVTAEADPASSQWKFDIVVDVDQGVPDGTFIVNTAKVSSDSRDDDAGNNSASARTEVIARADLWIEKDSSPEPVALGNDLTYTFKVGNNGPSKAINVKTVDTLPDFCADTNPADPCPVPTSLVDQATLPGGCSLVPPNAVNCDWGDQDAGWSGTYSFNVTMVGDERGLGFWDNVVVIDSDTVDPDQSSNGSQNDFDVKSQVVVAEPADGTATLTIQKFFLDLNNVTPVTFNAQCNNGQPVQASVTVFPDDPLQPAAIFGMYEVTFVIENIALINNQGATCTVTEEPVAGYGTAYYCDGDWSMSPVGDTCTPQVIADPYVKDETTACTWTDVQEDDSNFCYVVNYPLPVEVAVTKEWDITNPGGEAIDTTVGINIFCNSPILGQNSFIIKPSDYVDGKYTVKTEVIPNFERNTPPIVIPATECWATEDASKDNAVEVEDDCGDYLNPGMTVSAGSGDSCMFTNTVFFEGIPTLSQWGMAIMALLMLGVGLVGFRRFA